MLKLGGVSGSGARAYFLRRLLAGQLSLDGLPARPERVLIVLSDADLEDLSDALKALAPLFPEPLGEAALIEESPLSWPSALEKLRAGARVVLANPLSLSAAFPAPGAYEKERWTLESGATISRQKVLERLEHLGYSRAEFAEAVGEYAARGQVVDVYLPEPAQAARFLFGADGIETIRAFEPESQRTDRFLPAVTVLPLSKQSADASGGLRAWFSDKDVLFADTEITDSAWKGLSQCVFSQEPSDVDFGARTHPKYQGNLELVVRAVKGWKAAGLRPVLFGLNRGEEERLRELLEPKLPPGVDFLIGPIGNGFLHEQDRLSVLTSSEIFERSYRVRPLRPWQAPKASGRYGWASLKKGDYVVHKGYGIARYLGIVPAREVGDRLPEELGHRARPIAAAQDCLLLEFRGGDRLYVPLYDFKLVQKYVGAEGKRPRLSSLDTAAWDAAQKKAEEGVAELADEILKREAERRARGGHAFAPDTHLESEFEAAFPYEETPDQKKAIADVKRDMESGVAMDRVLVGDVGYGKTEVAMRAALKAVLDHKQAAVLVPTTVLADQHYRNFSRRFADYPVRVRMLSRFQSPAEQRAVLVELAQGRADVVVGTHRLLSKDVKFKDLGIMIIDEEHRFGVKDKERLKALRLSADALSLSATPIPRTLYSALSGLRSISLIESAPQGRQPVGTTVAPYSQALVTRAILGELERGGQVFYVFNHVKGLPERVRSLQAACPGAKFLMAHGQMPSGQLEKAMWDFLHRKYDVLVASTIIESGLDIPSVNTLIVEEAQDFGLAQLYQLRGRVGREKAKAFCFLLYPQQFESLESLSEDARKRLSALREFSSLGAGFRLALRDLEIRGAGDLLGAKQHGFLNAVGLEYYCNLLNREIERRKGLPVADLEPTVLDLSIPAGLPADYLPSELDRIEFYKRLLAAQGPEVDAIAGELEDLCGPPPEATRNLLRLVRMRVRAQKGGIRRVVEKDGGGWIEVTFRPGAQVDPAAVAAWTARYGKKMSFLKTSEGEGEGVRVDTGSEDSLAWLEGFLSCLVSK